MLSSAGKILTGEAWELFPLSARMEGLKLDSFAIVPALQALQELDSTATRSVPPISLIRDSSAALSNTAVDLAMLGNSEIPQMTLE